MARVAVIRHPSLQVALPLLSALLLAADLQAHIAIEITDPQGPTTDSTAHRCPEKFVMTGLHHADDRLLCARISPQFDGIGGVPFFSTRQALNPGDLSGYRGPAIRWWCGPNAVMIGMLKGGFGLADGIECSVVPEGVLTSIFADRPPRQTVRQAMHACPDGSVMVGADIGSNILACASVASINPSETTAGARVLGVSIAQCTAGNLWLYGTTTAIVPKGQTLTAPIPSLDPIRWECFNTPTVPTAPRLLHCGALTNAIEIARSSLSSDVAFICLHQ